MDPKDKGPNLAWTLAILAIAQARGAPPPLPNELITQSVGDWTIHLNNGPEPAQIPQTEAMLDSFHIMAEHSVYFWFAHLEPGGGMIAGGTEADFIADMNATLPEAERR